MASLITQSGKELLVGSLREDVDSDFRSVSGYYIGLARSRTFTAGSNPSSLSEQRKIRETLQSVKTVNGVSHVAPLVSWSSAVFNAYDDDLPSQTNYYVVNSDNEVFVVIEQSKNTGGVAQASTIEPTTTLQTAEHATNPSYSFKTSDGYVWKFMYKLSGLAIANFKSTNYLPVKKVGTGATITEEVAQKSIQDSAAAGEILSIAIDDGGSGYSSAPTITITGNGTSAAFECDVSSGAIVRVKVDSNGSGEMLGGSGYDYAKVSVSGNASLRAVLGPRSGLQAEPVEALRSKSIVVQTDFEGTESDTILTDNDFLQAVLLKDITQQGSTDLFSANTGNGLDVLRLQTGAGTFTEDELVTGGTSGASARVVHQEQVGGEPTEFLYIYQDEETGYGTFDSAENVAGSISGINRTVTNLALTPVIKPADIDRYSGRILHINTLDTAIDRQSGQTEDVKAIIKLG